MSYSHFKNRYQEPFSNKPLLVKLSFNELSHEDRVGLESTFSLQDIKDVIWNAASRKSLGPYGFSMEFFKASRDIIKSDLFDCIGEFFLLTHLHKAILASLMLLIPKCQNPQSLNDYFMICLIWSIYCIISKLKTGRLKRVSDKLIYVNHSHLFIIEDCLSVLWC